MDPRVYSEVEERANGRCEACGAPFGIGLSDRPELDHAFGRANAPETVATCWMLHASCHRNRHDAHPSAAFWLAKFILHCSKYRYEEEKQRAKDRLAWLQAKHRIPVEET